MPQAVPAERSDVQAAAEGSGSGSGRKRETELQFRAEPSDEYWRQVSELASQFGLTPVAARVLVGRGIVEPEKVEEFLSPTLRSHVPNPAQILHIEAAADLLLDAIAAKRKITIYSDFDVDGLSAGAQLFLFLQALGAEVSSYTPSRFTEGYGLVISAVERLIQAGTEVLVTVDCGITSHKELQLAKRHGLQTVVIDHHLPHGECPADVVVDPAQGGCPYEEQRLCAAGLVWMLLVVLRQRLSARHAGEEASPGEKKGVSRVPDPKDFLDLAALGTICDMVPLMGVNRVLASRGVEALKNTERPGLVALKKVAGLYESPRFGAGNVGFAIGPRINAAGRLADANEVFHLLTTRDSVRAKSIAETINRLNDQRREVEETVRADCHEFLQANPEFAQRAGFAIYGETYHIGVIGIVAQRLVEHFARPVAVMAPGQATIGGKVVPVIKGSVRSVRGFHVADALQSLSSFLMSHGGHAEAGGFSLAAEHLEAFQQAFADRAAELLGDRCGKKHLLADAEVSLGEIDFSLAEELQRFAPFGVGNPTPLLVTRRLDVHAATLLGEKHVKLRLTDGRNYVNAVAWSMFGHPLLRKGQRVDVAYVPEINSYGGIASVQLHVKEVWCSESSSS